MTKRKSTKDKQRSTKHTHKTKDRVTHRVNSCVFLRYNRVVEGLRCTGCACAHDHFRSGLFLLLSSLLVKRPHLLFLLVIVLSVLLQYTDYDYPLDYLQTLLHTKCLVGFVLLIYLVFLLCGVANVGSVSWLSILDCPFWFF
jgi:hypothetical protein